MQTVTELPRQRMPLKTMEARVLPCRRENRETIRRLFQGFVDDYGPSVGGKIIRVIVDELGGLRLTVPRSSKHNGVNVSAVRALFCRLCGEFGKTSGAGIMRKFLADLGGMRVSFPSWQDLYREERDRKIKNAFNGDNHNELALLWNMSVTNIRFIVFCEGERRRN